MYDSNFNLGYWVSHRRQDYLNGFLEDEKVKLLESFPGWVWNTEEAVFSIKAMQKLFKNYGDLNVPILFKDKDGYGWVSGYPIGGMILRKKIEFKKLKMLEEI